MKLTVGTIVRLKVPLFKNPAGALGVGFNDYGVGDCHVIFENGEYDGFDIIEEADTYLEEVGFSKEVAPYKFTNVIKLARDFEAGVFDSVLNGKNKL